MARDGNVIGNVELREIGRYIGVRKEHDSITILLRQVPKLLAGKQTLPTLCISRVVKPGVQFSLLSNASCRADKTVSPCGHDQDEAFALIPEFIQPVVARQPCKDGLFARE